MTETTWSEEVAQPPKKKGIPVWVWGCGGGCLLALIAALVGGVFFVGKFKEAVDPEVVWPKIAQVLPHDQRPNYRVFGGSLGIEIYVMIDESEGFTGLIFPGLGEGMSEEDRKELDQLFTGELKGGAFGFGEIEHAEPVTLDVQGKSCRAVRFQSSSPSIPGVPQNEDPGQMMVDLSRDPNRFVLLQLVDPDGEVNQADVDAFLQPFDVWR